MRVDETGDDDVRRDVVVGDMCGEMSASVIRGEGVNDFAAFGREDDGAGCCCLRGGKDHAGAGENCEGLIGGELRES